MRIFAAVSGYNSQRSLNTDSLHCIVITGGYTASCFESGPRERGASILAVKWMFDLSLKIT